MQSGNEVCNLSVATSESWKDKATGEKKERTQWHRVVIFNQGIVGFAKKYLKKGDRVYIEGQIETRKWQDKDGKDQYSTEIVLRPYAGELIIITNKDKGDTPQADESEEKKIVEAYNDFDDPIPF
jgi:single-strand DNA-binding protein